METLGKAIRASMRAYWEDQNPEELHKVQKGRAKYTKKYFDKFEKGEFGSATEAENM